VLIVSSKNGRSPERERATERERTAHGFRIPGVNAPRALLFNDNYGSFEKPLEDPYEKAPDSFSADFFSEHPAPCPSPGRKLWYSVAVPVSFLQLRPRLLYSTRVLRRVLSAAVLRARVSPTRVLLRLLPALLSSSVLSTRLGRLWVAEVLRARAVWLRSLTAGPAALARSNAG
jgi:hypothetical protein